LNSDNACQKPKYMKNKTHKLPGLPSALYSKGEIDTELLDAIFKTLPRPSNYIKQILKFYTRQVPRKHEERLRIIAEKIVDPKGREKWYQDVDKKFSSRSDKGKSIRRNSTHFYQIVNRWVISEPDCAYIDTQYPDFGDLSKIYTTDSEGTVFLDPKSIPGFIKKSFEHKCEPRKLALFLWAFAEAASWRGFEGGIFDLDNVEKELGCRDIEVTYLKELKRWFDPCTLDAEQKDTIDSTLEVKDKLPIPPVGTDDSLLSNNISPEVWTEPKVEKENKNVSKIRLIFEAKLEALMREWEEYGALTSELPQLTEEFVKNVSSEIVLGKLEIEIKKYSQRMKTLFGLVQDYEDCLENNINKYNLSLAKVYELIKSSKKNSLIGFESWIEAQKVTISKLDQIGMLTNRYAELSRDLQKAEIGYEWDGPYADTSSLLDGLEKAVVKLEAREAKNVVRAKIAKEALDYSTDPDWNPLNNSTISKNLVNAFSIAIEEVASPYLSGYILRKMLSSEYAGEQECIESFFSSWQQDIPSACKVLSMLTPAQIDGLWEGYSELRPLLTLSSINSWFVASKYHSPSAQEYWYHKPLSDVSNKQDEKSIHFELDVGQFYGSLRAAIEKEDDFNSKKFQETVALIDSGKDRRNSRSDQLYKRLKNKIIAPPSYSGIYGKLSNDAFEKIFSPISKSIKDRNVSNAKSEYDNICLKIDSQNWMSKNIFDSGIRNVKSEHKKEIQNYTRDMLGYISEWIDAEIDVSSTKKDGFIDLRKSMKAVLDRFDKVRRVDISDTVSATGWWLKNLQMDSAFMIQSALNPLHCDSSDRVPYFLIDELEFPWRILEAAVEGDPPTWARFFADTLSNWANSEIVERVVEHWRDTDDIATLRMYISANQLTDRSIPDELIGWVDSRQRELRKKFTADTSQIQLKLETYHGEDKELYTAELEDIQELVDSAVMLGLEERIEEHKLAVDTILDEYGDGEKRIALTNEIEILGGKLSGESSLVAMEEELSRLMQESSQRMLHIEVIRKLLKLPSLPPSLREDIQNLVKTMSQPSNLPVEEQSSWYEMILEDVLKPIERELHSPGTLHTDYLPLRLKLLEVIIQAISDVDWLKNSNSAITGVLIELGEKINYATSSNPIRDTRDIIDWLCAQVDTTSFVDTSGTWSDQNYQDPLLIPSRIGQGGQEDQKELVVYYQKARSILFEDVSARLSSFSNPNTLEEFDWNEVDDKLNQSDWAEVMKCCAYAISKKDASSLDTSILLSASLSIERIDGSKRKNVFREAFLFLADHTDRKKLPSLFLKKSQQDRKNVIGDIAISLLTNHEGGKIGPKTFSLNSIGDSPVILSRILGEELRSYCVNRKSFLLDTLWDYASNESLWGADLRAFLLVLCARSNIFGGLVQLLKKDPIKMGETRSTLFCQLLERTVSQEGWERFREYIESERDKNTSRPFSIFVDDLIKLHKPREFDPATIAIVGMVEKSASKNIYFAVLEVVPSVIDPPEDIEIQVPTNSPVLFGSEAKTRLRLKGPFLEKQQTRIELNMRENIFDAVTIDVQCKVRTVQETLVAFSQVLKIEANRVDGNFERKTPNEVEAWFDGFTSDHVRGVDFVPREEDEKRIERTLFGNNAGSLWITSPRRSGKTSMLYRIMDAYSYKNGRNDIVLYFTLDRKFDSGETFNKFIWRRILNDRDNRELKNHIDGLKEIGEGMDFSEDVDIFLSEISEHMLNRLVTGSRIYYVIDEVDKFAEMFLAGGEEKKTAETIMWQLRRVVSNEKNIGVIFAGSYAAQRHFVSNPNSPFYNSIKSVKLTPFSVETPAEYRHTMMLVQPKSSSSVFTMSKETIRHILYVTSGIPYYMKLLVGATYVSSDHEQIFPHDVNVGVEKMLARKTGVDAIDMLERPGEDELRTLYTASPEDAAMIMGVLLAVAHIRSPINRVPVRVGELWGDSSPLVSRAQLTKKQIEPALMDAREMGFLVTPESAEYQVEFAIPLLGESLSKRFNASWAEIEQRLEMIGGQR
jgi:hypothetical protein